MKNQPSLIPEASDFSVPALLPIEEYTLYGGRVKGKYNPNPGSIRYQASIDGSKMVRRTGVTTITDGARDKSRYLIPWAVGLYTDFIKEHLDMLKTGDAEELYALAEAENKKQKELAADLGTAAHDWIAADIAGQHPGMPEDERVTRSVTAWLDWKAKHDVLVVHSERIVYSLKHEYMGRLDFVAEITSCGEKCCQGFSKGTVFYALGDIKTGNGIYNSHLMQTSAYLEALAEENQGTKEFKKFDARVIVRLEKSDEKEFNDRIDKKNAKRVAKGERPFEAVYTPLEVVCLDAADGHQADFDAFLHAKAVHKWDYPAGARLSAAQGR